MLTTTVRVVAPGRMFGPWHHLNCMSETTVTPHDPGMLGADGVDEGLADITGG